MNIIIWPHEDGFIADKINNLEDLFLRDTIFVDNQDYFTWFVNVYEIGDHILGQSYFSSEEGYEFIYYRSGYYDEDNDTYSWNDFTCYITDATARSSYALKNHIHYNSATISETIRTYLDTHKNRGDYRIISTYDNECYILNSDSYDFKKNGIYTYQRMQRYYSISKPWVVYSRFGYYNPSTKEINWKTWHVTEGVEE